ncbi:cupin domain-containing protein [Sutcliffiella horikoshii]|uniref:cupin domain-containing protein n=1 Tax=Sutcliffiella horikoshii TaxID=79883 RepID=UPI001F327F62|nr:cupin domain-containing protein [Sutcliffiella horikoshii]MCG1020845.1 cupin domain-containing protein [Sutcliffiella horikoshii]
MSLDKVNEWVEALELEAHPEGGYYKQTYVSEENITDNELSVSFEGKRKLYSSIYFLLTDKNISHFHRLKSDELWYFHGGSSLTVHVITESGEYVQHKLGLNIKRGEKPQVLVPKNSIFGSTVDFPDSYALVGCMVSPGFEFKDFEMFTQSKLMEKYPEHEVIIRKMAYEVLPSGNE